MNKPKKTLYGLAVFIFLIPALIGASGSMSGSPAPSQILSSYFISLKDPETMQRIAENFEIVGKRGAGFEVIVPSDQVKKFLKWAQDAELLEADISEKLRQLDSQWNNGYHDFISVEEHLRNVAKQHPNIAHVATYGESKEGRPLFVLKLSDNVELDENEPELMFTSATHGNELLTVEVLLGLLDTLVQSYSQNSDTARAINEHELFFVPVVNPDGYVKKERYANGVDPNRDYPSPQKPNPAPNECIKAIIDFFHKHDIKGTLDFHSYGGFYMYPWAYSSEDPEHEKEFQALTSKMASTNGYNSGQISEIVWPVTGSSADYYYWKNATFALGVELGKSHAPDPDQLQLQIEKQQAAFLLFIESF